jgi:uncharacterized membrane protein HdeD (DUF308 family)
MTDATILPAFGPLSDLLARRWWLLLIRGLAAIFFGVATFVWPGISLLALILLYGAYAVVDGLAELAAAARGGGGVDRWWLILGGLISIAAGGVAFGWPGLTAVALAIIIGAWSIVRGIMEIAAGVALRKQIRNESALILGGAISVLFGIAIFMFPRAGALALLWLIGAWAVIFGLLMLYLAFGLRRLAH